MHIFKARYVVNFGIDDDPLWQVLSVAENRRQPCEYAYEIAIFVVLKTKASGAGSISPEI